jgi:hypothetical protein
MADYTLVGELPRHRYVWVISGFISNAPEVTMLPAVWFGLTSIEGRAWGLNVMLESGAVYRNVPPHGIRFCDDAPEMGEWNVSDAQKWDCYGDRFTTIEYRYFRERRVFVHHERGVQGGEYLFSAAPIGDGFSLAPEQAKEFSFIKLDNDYLTIQPTNYVLFDDRSFTVDNAKFPTDLIRQTRVWSAEE